MLILTAKTVREYTMKSSENNGQARRLCVYFFYDKDGIVDDYVVYYLKEMRPFFTDICVVVNGKLTTESSSKLKVVCDRLLVRENVGFDAWAYKYALDSYGLDYIAQNFDEVLLNNFTCFGPIGSFKPMFDKMNRSVCDFWGHCRYFPQRGLKVLGQFVPEHLMSYFILFRKKILLSSAWKSYWDTLKHINNYDDARLNHEFRLTGFFEQRGFISDSFINAQRCYELKKNNIVFDSYYQLKSEHSPLLKRKVFFVQNGKYDFYLPFSRYNKILYYVTSHHLYDMRMAFANLMRTGNFSFSDGKVTLFKRFKSWFLDDVIRLKNSQSNLAAYPDFDYIKKIMKL